MQRFVILSARRSGSNLLCTLLNSHPEILCHHEVFNPRGIFYARELRDGSLDLGTMAERDRDPLAFLQRLWDARPGFAGVGFKWTRDQNEDVLRDVLGDSNVKKLLLRRQNRIKTYVSEMIAEQTDQWEVYHGERLVHPRPQVSVDVAELRRYIAVNERLYASLEARLEEAPGAHLQLEFERLFEPDEQQRILRFLGVDDQQRRLSAASVKQNPSDLRSSIANFDELGKALRGTELEAELHSAEI